MKKTKLKDLMWKMMAGDVVAFFEDDEFEVGNEDNEVMALIAAMNMDLEPEEQETPDKFVWYVTDTDVDRKYLIVERSEKGKLKDEVEEAKHQR